MKKLFLALIFGGLSCTSCVTAVGPYGASLAVGPSLPGPVEVVDLHYFHDNHGYSDNRNKRWYDSKFKGGHWKDLPRDRYPREV